MQSTEVLGQLPWIIALIYFNAFNATFLCTIGIDLDEEERLRAAPDAASDLRRGAMTNYLLALHCLLESCFLDYGEILHGLLEHLGLRGLVGLRRRSRWRRLRVWCVRLDSCAAWR